MTERSDDGPMSDENITPSLDALEADFKSS